jgi:hypothetical protein
LIGGLYLLVVYQQGVKVYQSEVHVSGTTYQSIALAASDPLATAPCNNSKVHGDTGNGKLDEVMRRKLEGSDPMARRDAIVDLAKLGLEALPFIDNVLADAKSSDALTVGVLSALNSMGGNIQSESHLSGKALKAIVFLASSDDKDIAKGAADYIRKRGPLSVHKALTTWLISHQHKGVPLNDIALADKDLMNKIGMRAERAYRLKQDPSLFAEASIAFDQGWSDRQFAGYSDKVYFADALYGWGLLLADRAVAEKGKGGASTTQLVQAAKDKFQEFLKAAQLPNSPSYDHANQIKQAKAYIDNPASRFLTHE